MEEVLRKLTLEFFGSGRHKMMPESLFKEKSAVLLDVRSAVEAATIAVKLSAHKNIECRHIPVDEIPDRFEELPKDRMIAVFCSGNVRSAIVYAFLLTRGFDQVRVLEGGYDSLTESVKPGRLLKYIQAPAPAGNNP